MLHPNHLSRKLYYDKYNSFIPVDLAASSYGYEEDLDINHWRESDYLETYNLFSFYNSFGVSSSPREYVRSKMSSKRRTEQLAGLRSTQGSIRIGQWSSTSTIDFYIQV